MSRAFVKEDDGDDSNTGLPERPHSPHTNYVTPKGKILLTQAVEALEADAAALRDSTDLTDRQRLAYLERDLRYYRSRLNSAIVVDPENQPHDRVHFGATVVVEDDQGQQMTFSIVGEDEADAAKGKISWVSPLAKSLLNMQPGDEVTWYRPAGAVELEIIEIR